MANFFLFSFPLYFFFLRIDPISPFEAGEMSAFSKNIVKKWHRFIQNSFNIFLQSAPNVNKQRKYKHIEI